VTIDTTVLSYCVLGIVAYYTLLFLSSLRRPPLPSAASLEEPLMVLLVPARNEELVLEDTLVSLAKLSYSDYRIIVVNDASTDRTSDIAHAWAAMDSRTRVLDRSPEIAGRGKSAVLNHGFELLQEMFESNDPFLAGRPDDRIVLVIVDADGQIEAGALQAVAPYFEDASVGQVQIGVQIQNANASMLTRMQDIEFVGFSCLAQASRDHLGSTGLGGNGQFTRFSALRSLGGAPWRPASLTEDLDLGLRLVRAGWRTRYCDGVYVYQQGLTKWRPLLRQRTRWIQGHYQCWRHIPSLVGARGAKVLGRLDLIVYLLLVLGVAVIGINLVLDYLARLGVIHVVDTSMTFLPAGMLGRVLNLLLAFLPLTAFMITYQRHSAARLRWWEVPAFGILFTLYTLHWIVATLRAWFRLSTRRGSWTKTPRVQTAPADPPTAERSLSRR
jgi:1,2-diacylglycerol 3-beta-glucosyltransferase